MPARWRRCVATAAVAVGCIPLVGCGVTPQTYCDNRYTGPDAGTPEFARRGDLFRDTPTCLQWFDRVKRDEH